MPIEENSRAERTRAISTYKEKLVNTKSSFKIIYEMKTDCRKKACMQPPDNIYEH